ncbi:Calreticulin family protein [Trichomonas vaginalis G3]|uniref:Calreticulin family protein n=1 Tax=Trichomonas vaginalis (strain ATCC PRA-98 / G3) TaxID=412133 RepID=A2F1Q8_TRIV3|nr:chaperone protein, calreticulin/calnexin family [Trichomonas vaginalis G3]EAY01168.1 Calreticulin family protein [Trichomonas vaginalis G3]KAI5547178.1 chaperone protein, calreticulin/calnexin family [Trichomonas vaginalis G3]|eukprot:XP_001330115.1 Calreticulin family protein [Trichomonas vaginalis G3]
MLLSCLFFLSYSLSKADFYESFESENSMNGWISTKAPDYNGVWYFDNKTKALSMATYATRYAITKKFSNPIILNDKDFIIQFEVEPTTTIDCTGGYLKLYGNKNLNERDVSNQTMYTLMFGPDRCQDSNSIHFIIKHKGIEKSLKIPPHSNLGNKTHLYSLVVRKNNNFETFIDNDKVRIGNFFTDFYPPINIREIPDPADKKPKDWVDDEYIVDETAKKPEDWDEDEPEFIPDPSKIDPPKGWLLNEPKTIQDKNAKKPDDWDEAVFGQWEAPQISNPKCDKAPGCGPYEAPLILNEKYKGKWEPPRYRNPLYRGPWRPRMISNPDYVEDKHPANFGEIWAVGFELWAVTPSLSFRKILIDTNNVDEIVNEMDQKQKKMVQQKNENEEIKFNPVLNFEDLKNIDNKLPFFEDLVNSWSEFYKKDKGMAISMLLTMIITPIFGYYIHRKFF